MDIFNIFLKCYPILAVKGIIKLTSEAAGVCGHTIYNTSKEKKGTGTIKIPEKKEGKIHSVLGQVDDFAKSACLC